MSDKKLYTRSEFENMRTDSAKKMSQDTPFIRMPWMFLFVQTDILGSIKRVGLVNPS